MVDGVSISGFDGTSIATINKKLEARIDNSTKGPSIEDPSKKDDDDEKEKAAGTNSSGRGTIVDVSV